MLLARFAQILFCNSTKGDFFSLCVCICVCNTGTRFGISARESEEFANVFIICHYYIVFKIQVIIYSIKTKKMGAQHFCRNSGLEKSCTIESTE